MLDTPIRGGTGDAPRTADVAVDDDRGQDVR